MLGQIEDEILVENKKFKSSAQEISYRHEQ